VTQTQQANWNLADIFDAVARVVPADRPAIVQGAHTVTWGELDARSNRLARALIAAGHGPGERVGFLSRNHPGYIEGFVACLKARLIHVNLNYRYTVDEIAGVLEDAGATAIFFHPDSGHQIAALQARLPQLRTRICLQGTHVDATASCDAWAVSGDASPLDIVRAGDDPLLLYTGGTTGRPKGVIWPGDRYRACQLESPLVQRRPADLAEHIEIVRAQNGAGRVLPACPLMHGAGISSTLAELLGGGTALLLQGTSFDPDALWQLAERGRASRILIVGDVFARPMLRALDARPGHYRLEHLKVISSAGLMWSEDVKNGLLRHMPWLVLADIYGASEASGLGYAVSTLGKVMPTGRFHPGPQTVLIAEDGALVPAGVAAQGWLARGEPLPLGYHGDARKTAEVFRMIDGARYAVPGDWVRRHADGTMQLLGRGSLVINTGGEKVFVEEVEEALKLLPEVSDALVVGLPDPRWGSTVAALVTMHAPDSPDLPRWRQAMAASLAAYKMPRFIWRVDRLPRADSGKGDYRAAQALAVELRERSDPAQPDSSTETKETS
jgi:3-oxocholest-4-en-26-oate---CoA ligase